MTPDGIIDFWFSDSSQQRWFKSTPAFDRELADRFGACVEAAGQGQLDDWMNSARGSLALVILLDQFPRNIHRGTADAYRHDASARSICKHAVDVGQHRDLSGWYLGFLYMPLMHSEDIQDQELSVRLFTEAGLDNTSYAIHHRDIVRRFGRFPHRNRLFGRESTREELEYLDSEDAFTG